MPVVNPAGSGGKDQQTVAQAAGFHRVVGDQHDGAVYQQPGGQGLNARAGNRVERGKGLVHQHDGPVFVERTRQRRTLAHAA